MNSLLRRMVSTVSAAALVAVVALSATTATHHVRSANVMVAGVTSNVAHHYPT